MTAYEDYQAKLDALKKKKKAQQALLKTSEEQIPLLDLLGDKTKISAETARINVEISKIQKEISRIDSSIADEKKAFADIKSERLKKENPEEYRPKNLPQGINDKLYKDLTEALPGINVDTFFLEGGAGNNMLVYMGKEDVTVTGRPSSGGVKTGQIGNVVQLTTNLEQSFWSDPKTKNKVKTLLSSAGKPSDDLSAFAAWESVVAFSAKIYKGGKGPELTPFDIMKMQIKNSGGPQKRVDKVDQNVLKALIENVYSSVATRKPTPAETEARLQELNKFVDAGTVTTTSGNTTVTSAGFTQAGAEALIKQKVEAEAPTDVARTKGLQFKDELSSWMRSGI
jgi:hypothetical protein